MPAAMMTLQIFKLRRHHLLQPPQVWQLYRLL
jgi:hypothetical protein